MREELQETPTVTWRHEQREWPSTGTKYWVVTNGPEYVCGPRGDVSKFYNLGTAIEVAKEKNDEVIDDGNDLTKPVPRTTVAAVDAWIAATDGLVLDQTESAFQQILENVSPELCGYAIAKIGARYGY